MQNIGAEGQKRVRDTKSLGASVLRKRALGRAVAASPEQLGLPAQTLDALGKSTTAPHSLLLVS